MSTVKVTYEHPHGGTCPNESNKVKREFYINRGVYNDIGFVCATCYSRYVPIRWKEKK